MPPAIARGSTTREVPQQFDVTSKFTQDDLLRAVLSRRAQLSADRKLPVGEWVGRLLTSRSSMVQVGANDHSVHYGNTDPGPYCVKRGWKTLLIEPVPTLFAKLSTQYDSSFVHNSRTRLLNAAVCSRSCVAENRTFWSVDMSNATGNWGTNRSDARCAQLGGAAWVSEIASLRQWHLIAQARNLKYTQAKCDKCAGKLGKPMPPDCLSQVIQENMVSHVVSCTCLAEELREWTAVTLLMIDTEGYDYEVLKQFPFDRLRPARVVYESLHLSNADNNAAAAFMMRLGYGNILGGLGKVGLSVWHHLNSTESYNESFFDANGAPLPIPRRGRRAGAPSPVAAVATHA